MLVSKYPGFAAAYPGRKFNKGAITVHAQKSCFVQHVEETPANLDEVHDFVMSKIPALPSLQSKMRCVNVPRRLEQAAVASRAAAEAAAAAPAKATMDDNLHCRVVQFVKWSQTHLPLADLFNRYYGNEHSRSRRAQDTPGFRCAFIFYFFPTIFTASSPSPLQVLRYSQSDCGHVQHQPRIQ